MTYQGKRISAILILVAGAAVFMLLAKHMKTELGLSEWSEQNIAGLQFSYPSELRPISKGKYGGLMNVELYSDLNNEHIVYAMMAQVINDSVSLVDAYGLVLESLLDRHGIDPRHLKMDNVSVDASEMSSDLYFDLKQTGSQMRGYGFLHRDKKKIESIWLVPLTHPFSPEFIKKFKEGLNYRYDRELHASSR